MKQESLFNNEPSIKFQKIIKEHGEVYANPSILKQKVESYVERIKEEITHNEFINVELAKKIRDVCMVLIDEYEKASNIDKKYINATINYFITTDDDEEDLFSPLGFDDDAEIINECLKLIKKENLSIDM